MRCRRFSHKAKTVFMLLTMVAFLANSIPPLSGQDRPRKQETEPNNTIDTADRFMLGEILLGTASGLDPGPRQLPSLNSIIFGGDDAQVDIFRTILQQPTRVTTNLGFGQGSWDIFDPALFRNTGTGSPPFANITDPAGFIVVLINSVVLLPLLGFPVPSNVCEYVSEINFLVLGPVFTVGAPAIDPRTFANPCLSDLDYTVISVSGGDLFLEDSPLAGPQSSLLLAPFPAPPEPDFFGSGTQETTPSGDVLEIGFRQSIRGPVFIGISDQTQGWISSPSAASISPFGIPFGVFTLDASGLTEFSSEFLFFLFISFPFIVDIPTPAFFGEATTGSRFSLSVDTMDLGGSGKDEISENTVFPEFVDGGVTLRRLDGSPLLLSLTKRSDAPLREAYSMTLDRATTLKLNVGLTKGQVDVIYVVNKRTKQVVAKGSERVNDRVVSTGLLNLEPGEYIVGVAAKDKKTVYLLTASNATNQIMAVMGKAIDIREQQEALQNAVTLRQTQIQRFLANLTPQQIQAAKLRIAKAGVDIEANLNHAIWLGADPQMVQNIREHLVELGLLDRGGPRSSSGKN